MNRIILVILAAAALLLTGGFAAGMAIGAWNPTKQLGEAQGRIHKLETDLSKAKDGMADLKKQLEAAKNAQPGDAARLAKAQKRIAELEHDLVAARRAATALKAESLKNVASAQVETNKTERVIALDGDGDDILGTLQSKLSHEEFSQVTNAMTQLRARLAEKAKGRMEYLASINTDGMSDDERKNHARFLELMERREAIAAKMKGGFPDAASIQKMVELEMEMAPVAKKARSALVGQVARELGYQGEDVDVVRDTVNTIFDCTSGGGLGGLSDMMENAGGMPGMGASPDVKVETHVIGL